jgi:hypothetical protein
VDDAIEAIRQDLKRLEATVGDVAPMDAISVHDRGNGNATLLGSPRKTPDFHWFGSAVEIHERPAGLPDGSGPEVIRSEFAR